MNLPKKDEAGLQDGDCEAIFEAICRENGMDTAKAYRQLQARLFPRTRIRRMVITKALPAAAALLVIVLCLWLLHPFRHPKNIPAKGLPSLEIASLFPVQHGIAILTMASGKQVRVDTVEDGSTLESGIKKQGDTLVYPAVIVAGNIGRYDTLTTPKSAYYHVVLPDGSKVKLNNDSRLIYPAVFAGNTRTVSLRGEACFTVTHDARRPFRVLTRDMTAQVLGTIFNISVYPEDTVTRTLMVQGRLAIISRYTGKSITLDSGDQDSLTTSGIERISRQSDPVDTAWLNGRLRVKPNTSLEVVLNQLARWYDVGLDIKTSGLPESHYIGWIDSSVSLGSVIDYLRSDNPGLKIELQGNKIVVSR
jgi:transmembrane sensor